MPKSNVLLIIIIAALTGLTIFGVMIWRVTQVENSTEAETQARFSAIRSRFESPAPVFRLGTKPLRGTTSEPVESDTEQPDTLRVMVYSQRTNRLVSSRIPFWFYELKAPAVELTLRGAGFDPVAMGVTLEDMKGHGIALLLDEVLDNGDLILVWTE